MKKGAEGCWDYGDFGVRGSIFEGEGEGATPGAQDIVRTLECVIFVMIQSPFCHHDRILSDWQLLDIWMGLMLDPSGQGCCILCNFRSLFLCEQHSYDH